MNSVSRFFLFAAMLVVLSFPAFAGDAVPPWVSRWQNTAIPTYEKGTNAVNLVNDTVATVNQDGRVTTTYQYAVKVLLREGREEAIARQLYLTSSSRVTDFKAWLIRANGTTKAYGKKEILDIISDPDDVYDEYRVKLIDATEDADVGSIFGFEAVVEEAPIFNQDIAFFQTDLPVVISRYALNLPAGWKATANPFNTNVQPVVNGSSYTWEMRDLPPIPYEPASPSYKNLAPHIAISYGPDNPGRYKVFNNWTEVSRWNTEISNASLVIDDAVALRARDLTANAKTEFEKIYAIGTFAQNLQYISIDIGVGRGNGYIPRPSNTVLSRGYGDCKDKANLMRALLKVLKIDSYLVSIHSGDPTFVREDWASPRQFNHCIIAIRISDETKTGPIINHPTLGRLMIFDPTDEYTPVGDLPEYLQGSLALIVAGDDGKLMRMPETAPEANKLDRQTELALDPMGNLSGTIKERSIGQSAANERRGKRSLSPSEYNKMIERWIVAGISTARINKIDSKDKSAEGRFDLDVEFNAPLYAQLMQGRLMVFKPAVVSRLNSLSLTEPKRKHSIVLGSHAFSETSTIKLPQGFIVDEMPEAVKLETTFGQYTTAYEVKEDKLIFKRSLTMKSSNIPADKYKSVQDFFVGIRNAEQAPVVLMKK